MSLESLLIQQFREKLGNFVFFHLGSDARIRLEEKGEVLEVSLEHQRIRPLQFQLDADRLEVLATDPALFEETMLDHLVAHRRT